MRLLHVIRSRTFSVLVSALVACGVACSSASAQSNSGASDLLFPIGARVVGMGGTAVADQGGEGIWANPAGIARMKKPEFAFDHFSTFVITSGDAVSLVIPAGVVGVFGLSARLFNYCTTAECTATDSLANETGTINTTSLVLGATFAATFGNHVSAGITGRIYRFSNDCSGVCPGAFGLTLEPSITGLVDFGMQFRPSATGPLEVGVLLANWGRNLQVNNQEQADPLPARVHVGASYAPTSPTWDPALTIRMNAEFIASASLSTDQEVHVGIDVGYTSANTTLNLRGGYGHDISGGAALGVGPSVGFGIASGRVRLDFARIFDSFSQGLGTPPTYVSIRVGL